MARAAMTSLGGEVAAMASLVFHRPHSASRALRLADAAQVAGALRGGSLAVLPTETGYMLAALATSAEAVERAFAVKRRDPARVMHVACASLDMAEEIGVLSPAALGILGKLTPGPVSVIVAKTPLLPDRLVTMGGTVGIRVPDHPATLQVIQQVGAPLTATSLNESGAAPQPISGFDLGSLTWPAGQAVQVVEDDAAIVYSSPSTLVRVVGTEIAVLRPGPVGEPEIRRAAGLI